MSGFSLRMLGGFQLAAANGEPIPIPQRKRAALIAYLGATIGSNCARDRLASLLWGQSEQRLARQSLRQTLRALGQDLGGGERILRLDRYAVGLDADCVRVDTAEFESLLSHGDPQSLAKASDLYRGEFLAGLSVDSPDFEEWLTQSRGRYRDLALHALNRLIEEHETASDYERASQLASRALRIDPFREDMHRCLMRMYAARGMRSASLSQYEKCEEILKRELGVSPDKETSRLYESILARGTAARPAVREIAPRTPVPDAESRNIGTHFVGMDRELDILWNNLKASADSRIRMVLVTGETGAGKSALLEAFRKRMDRRGMTMATARARPAERMMNYAFWADLLGNPALESVGDQEENSSLSRRLAFLRGTNGTWNGRGDAADRDHRPVFDAMVDFIRAHSRDTTLILAIEDIHHADAASLRLLSYILRNVGPSSVLVLATLRPEGMAGRRDVGEVLDDLDRDQLLHRLPLQPLSRANVEKLVDALRQAWGLQTPPRSWLREIWTLSDGNPGIVVELVRSGFGVDAPNATHDLPATLYAELAGILKNLDDSAKLLAAAASVIGEGIQHGLLEQVTGLDEETTLRGVEALVTAGLLTLKSDKLVFTRGRLQLSQYRSMLPARRRQLHLAVATALVESIADDPVTHYAALVHHYTAAGHFEDALRYELRLGQAHSRRGDYGLARRTFRRVIRTVQGMATDRLMHLCRVEARLRLAEIEEVSGKADAAMAVLRGLATDGKAVPSARLSAQLLYALGRLYDVLGNDAVGQGAIRQAANSVKGEEENLWQLPDRILEKLHFFGGRFESGLEHLVHVRERSYRYGFATDAIVVSATLGLLHAAQGSADPAFIEVRTAIGAATRLGDDRLLALGKQAQGMAHTWCGDPRNAVDEFNAAFDLAAQRGDALRLYQIRCHRGHALIRAGLPARALADLEQALKMASAMNIRFTVPLCRAWKAWALVGAGDPVAARNEARVALNLAADANRLWPHSVANRALASALAAPAIADFVSAEQAIRTALEAQYALGLEFERATSLVAYARILHAAGETQRSKSMVGQAQSLFKQLKMVLSRDALQDLIEMRCNPCGVSV